MKLNIEHIKTFSFHIAKELGYIGEETLDGLKTFLTEKYNVVWDISSEKLKQYKAKYGGIIKPDMNKVTTYSIYTKNEWCLVETLLFSIYLFYM